MPPTSSTKPTTMTSAGSPESDAFTRMFVLRATVAPFFHDLLRAGRLRRGQELAERLGVRAA